eukprot:gene15402-biopygen7520
MAYTFPIHFHTHLGSQMGWGGLAVRRRQRRRWVPGGEVVSRHEQRTGAGAHRLNKGEGGVAGIGEYMLGERVCYSPSGRGRCSGVRPRGLKRTPEGRTVEGTPTGHSLCEEEACSQQLRQEAGSQQLRQEAGSQQLRQEAGSQQLRQEAGSQQLRQEAGSQHCCELRQEAGSQQLRQEAGSQLLRQEAGSQQLRQGGWHSILIKPRCVRRGPL